MKRIRKNAKKRIADIFENTTLVICYSLDDGFRGREVENPSIRKDGHFQKATLAEFLYNEFIRFNGELYDNENDTFTLHIHSNLWYTIG